MHRNSKFLLWALAILLLTVSPSAFAATQNAVVYGTVYDAGGNPLPGVDVTLENPAIGFSRNATTGSDGSYTFPEVPPAENYKLSASQASRKIDVRSGITVNVGDERVILPPLKEQPVASNQPVETKADAPAVTNETVSTTISGVITGDQLRALPVAVNRNFLGLGLIPHSTHDVEPGSALAGASFSVSGNRPSSNSFLLDGADNVASSSNQAVPFQVNDSVQEFRVISGTANAEYGRNLGGTVNVVTKRGDNAFHGSAFGYFNNDALNSDSPLSVYNGTTFDKAAAYAGPLTSTFTGFSPLTYNDYVASAKSTGFCADSNSLTTGAGLTPCPSTGLFGKNTFFDPATVLKTQNSRKMPFDSKQFGLNLGGPLSKDKWFAFGSYEGTMIDNPTPAFERVPSAFDRTYAPYGTAGFGFSRTNPSYVLAQNVLGLFPKSNVVGVPGVLEFFRGQAPNYTDVHNALLRSDYIHSDKTSFSARYAMQFLNELHDDSLPRQTQYAGNGAYRDVLNQNLNVSYTHTFTPAWITEARVGFNRFRVNETPQDHNLNAGALGLSKTSMPTILLNGIDPQYSGAGPVIDGATAGWSDFFNAAFGSGFFGLEQFPTLDHLFPFARIGAPLGAPTHRRDTTLFFADNTSWSHGRHAMKFGAEFRHLNNEYNDGSFVRGFMYSQNIGEFTSDSETCNEECAFNLGNFNAFLAPSFDFYQQQQAPYTTSLHSWAFAGFLQDSWHVHPRVTLNLGLRYEYFAPSEDQHNQLWNFSPAANGLVQENHSTVEDTWGHPCTALPPYDALSGGVTNAPIINRPWLCNNNAGVFNQIVRPDRNDLAPRAGMAWDVFGSGKTVFRMAGGLFYDQLPASYTAQLMYNRPATFANGNALFGVVRDIRGRFFCPAGNFTTCGVGNAVVNSGVQTALSRDGLNPNSFYARAAEPFAVYARDTLHSMTPYSMQMSASVQQQLSNKLTAEVGYVGDLARKLPVIYNQNFSNEFNLDNGVAGNFTFFPIFTMANRGNSSYHSGFLRVRTADWHGLRLNGSYVFSKSIDNASSSTFRSLPLSLSNLSIAYQVFGSDNPVAECIFFALFCSIGGEKVPLTIPTINFSPTAVTTTGAGQPQVTPYLIPQSPGNFMRNDRGRSDFNSTHRGVIDYSWDVPSLHKALGTPSWLDDWQFSGVFTAQSGQPFTIFAGPIAGEVTQRVNVVGPVQVSDNPNGAISATNIRLASQSAACSGPYLSTATFVGNLFQPTPGNSCTGNSGRNAFTGPDYVNMNFAVQKRFHLMAEGKMLTLRMEVYNLFDRANFYNPISTYSTDGVTLNPDFGKIKSAHDPREIQFAIRFTW
jgi:hypothetical protein